MKPPTAVDWKSLDTLVLVDAGITTQADGTVRLPYRDASGAEHNAKLYANGRTWYEHAGLSAIPYGLDHLAQPDDRDQRILWIAEGESDALALRGYCATWRSHPADTIALPGASTWRPEWGCHAQGYRGVYLFPDGDNAGHKMAERVAADIPTVIRVYMPGGEDVRSLLHADGGDLLDALIRRAEATAILHAGLILHPTLDGFEQYLREVEW